MAKASIMGPNPVRSSTLQLLHADIEFPREAERGDATFAEHQHRILLIEDDFAFASQCQAALRLKNYLVDVSVNCSAGFREFHARTFDLLILDIMVPGMNAVDLLKKLRAQKRYERFPIIVLANSYLQSVYVEVRSLQPAFILSNHAASIDELLRAVDAILRPPANQIEAIFDRVPPAPGSVRSQAAVQVKIEPGFDDDDPFSWEVGPAPQEPEVTAQEPEVTTVIWGKCRRPSTRRSANKQPPEAEKTALGAEIKPAAQNQWSDAKRVEQALQALLGDLVRLRRVPWALTGEGYMQQDFLQTFYNNVHLLAAVDYEPYEHIKDFAVLLEAFVFEISRSLAIKDIAGYESIPRTLAQALDLLENLILKRIDFRPPTNRHRSVVVIERDQTTRLMLKLAILKLGVKAYCFEQEAEAESFLKHKPVDLLVMNADYLVVDYKPICERMREESRNMDTPLILLAAEDTMALKMRCLVHGAAFTLIKPVRGLEFAVRVCIVLLSPAFSLELACVSCRFKRADCTDECLCNIKKAAWCKLIVPPRLSEP